MEIGKVSQHVLATVAADVCAGVLLGAVARKVSTVSAPLFGAMAAGVVFLMSLSVSSAVFKLGADFVLPEDWMGYSLVETLIKGVRRRSDSDNVALAKSMLFTVQMAFEGFIAVKIMRAAWPKFGFLAFPTMNALTPLAERPAIKREWLKLIAAAQASAAISCYLKKNLLSKIIK